MKKLTTKQAASLAITFFNRGYCVEQIVAALQKRGCGRADIRRVCARVTTLETNAMFVD